MKHESAKEVITQSNHEISFTHMKDVISFLYLKKILACCLPNGKEGCNLSCQFVQHFSKKHPSRSSVCNFLPKIFWGTSTFSL